MGESELLTIEGAALYLNVKRSWLYAHREVPRLKLGAGLRFRRSDLDGWLSDQTVGVGG